MSPLLVVSNSTEQANRLAGQLGSAEYEVVRVSGAEHVQPALLREHPEAILVTCASDDGCVVEACRRIKHDAGADAPPLILLLSDFREATVDAALDAGADDVLAAPACSKLLNLRIHQAIDARKARRKARAVQVALKKSESRYRRYIDHSPVAICVADPEGRYVKVNKTACQWTGYSEEELLNRSIVDLLADPDHAGNWEYRKRLEREGVATGGEFAFRRKDGVRLWLTVNAMRLEGGGSIAFCTDVTARREMEEALRTSEEKLRVVSDAVLDAIVMMDPRGRIAYWNPGAERIFGYTRDEALGRDVHTALAPPRYREGAARGMAEFLRTGCGNAVGKMIELEGRHKAGHEFPIELSLASLTLNSGTWAIAVVRDVTQRKRAEIQLQQYTVALESANEALREFCDAAEQANRAKSQFLANMSHELRTPLHGVLSFASFGIKKIKTAKREDLLRYFNHIERSGQILIGLVNDLLDLAKLESGKTQCELAEGSLATIVRTTVDEFGSMTALRGLGLRVNAPPDGAPCMVDAERIAQVVRNLLSNAIKFSPDGGQIVVTVNRLDEAFRVAVADRGVGIPEDELEAVFDEFVQSSKTRTGAGGTGLGLAISRQIVQQHGGRIWAKNRPGGGALVCFDIPTGQPRTGGKTQQEHLLQHCVSSGAAGE